MSRYDKNTSGYPPLSLNGTFGRGSKLMFEFIFANGQCHIYQDGKDTGHTTKFYSPHIIPLVCLHYVGETIKITRYELE